MSYETEEFQRILYLLTRLQERWEQEQAETGARFRAIVAHHEGHERKGLPCMTLRLLWAKGATDSEAYEVIKGFLPPEMVSPEHETKSEQYLRQSEQAAAEIRGWPLWMQKNLKPTTVAIKSPLDNSEAG